MDREKFETLVVRAIANLPTEFRSKLENVDVVVEDWPSSVLLKELKIRHPGQLLRRLEWWRAPSLKNSRLVRAQLNFYFDNKIL